MEKTTIKLQNSVGYKLLKVVFSFYIFIAVVVTAAHIAQEYYFTKDSILEDLQRAQKSFENGLTNSIWQLDEKQINASVQGIVQNSSIVGVAILSPDDKNIARIGVIGSENEAIKDSIFDEPTNLGVSFSSNLYHHSFEVIDNTYSEGEKLGVVHFYSNQGVIFERVKYNFLVIIINSIIKTVALWIIFLYFAKKILTRPLSKITYAAQELDIKNFKTSKVHINAHEDNELKVLERSFNNMIDKMEATFAQLENQKLIIEHKNQALDKINAGLEVKVKKEVKKNREKDMLMLKQSKQAAMGEMLGMIAHQWRQPLTAISSNISNLYFDISMGEIEEEQMEKTIDSINEQIAFLSNTIDDFRNFFKKDKELVYFTPEDVYAYVRKMMGNSLRDINVQLHIDFNEELYTYKNELVQVLINLMKNAADALKEKEIQNPTLHLFCSEKKEYVVFEVVDNAGGIPKEILEKIFEPYFSTKDDKNGTGLGLYMSKTIVEDHLKGKLLASNYKTGARFTVAITKELTK